MTEKHIPNKIRREESDTKIIRAAIKNFGVNGYTNTSISQIAKDAGVSPGLITNRYASKEELFDTAFLSVFGVIKIDYDSLEDAKNFLVILIDSVVNLYNSNLDAFKFMSMLYTSFDTPKSFKNKAREEFVNTKGYDILYEAQNKGNIQKGDIVSLVDAFLTHVYVQVGICKNYGQNIPGYDYFLAPIYIESKDYIEFYNRQFTNILLKEDQASWLIKLSDLSIQTITYEENKIIPDSVNTVQKLGNYDEARLWYIENCVVEQSKGKLIEQTSVDYILSRISNGETFFIEYGRKKNGEINYNQLCYNKLVNKNNEIEYISMRFRDIDVARRAEVDDLTGLLTRQTFFVKAKEMLDGNPDVHFDVVISDIVDFKKVNEIYGSRTADDILRWQGQYLQQFMRDDLLVGRYGGDQMVMFGSHEQIEKCINDEHNIALELGEGNNNLPSTKIKLGIYLDVKHESSIISSCDKAHMALNSIKYHYSKVVAYYNDDIKKHMEKQRRIEDSMYESLREGDFKVYYQPKHSACTGMLVGAEALIRWNHPKYGFMSPADFIPLFERNGFIVQSDQYVLDRTCENLRRWMDKGIATIPISINASKLTMIRDDLVEIIQDRIEKNKLLPSMLHIEITETLMTENTDALVKVINRIRELGCKIELDDFGSGYSSLNVLSTFPIDILKLDMSFLQQFGDSKRSIVLESCIEMAQKLGFITVSEGVELQEQKELLGKLGVDMIQGYFYSKPLSEEEFEQYMLDNSQ